MVEQRKLRFALAIVQSHTHKAVGGKRCGCGACAHWVAVAAHWARVPRKQLEAALPPAAKPEPRRRSRPRPESRVQICDSAAIRVRGADIDPQEGLAFLLARLHDSG